MCFCVLDNKTGYVDSSREKGNIIILCESVVYIIIFIDYAVISHICYILSPRSGEMCITVKDRRTFHVRSLL